MTLPSDRDALAQALKHESDALLDLLPRFSDAQWRTTTRADGWSVQDIVAHLADAHYGLALIVLGEAQPVAPVNPATGWMDVDAYNEQRRTKNAQLSRDKVINRLGSAFAQVQRAMTTTDDYAAPSAIGAYSKGQVLERIVGHNRLHRLELEGLLPYKGMIPDA